MLALNLTLSLTLTLTSTVTLTRKLLCSPVLRSKATQKCDTARVHRVIYNV